MPVIVVVAAASRRELLEEEFTSRYARDYDVRAATETTGAKALLPTLVGEGAQVALIAVDHGVEGGALMLMDKLRAVSPNSRRVVLISADDFRPALTVLRPALAQGRLDTYLLIPQGPRDEEFHTAISEYLSDWGWSSSPPEVVGVRIVDDGNQPAVPGIRDFLDRMGLSYARHRPDSDVGRDILNEAPGVTRSCRSCSPSGASRWSTPPSRQSRRRVYGSPADLGDDYVARPARRGRRAGRPRCRGVRRQRGSADGRARRRGRGRPGRDQLDDPQLPRLPARRVGDAARDAGARAGDPLRRAAVHRPRPVDGIEPSDGAPRDAPRAARSRPVPCSSRAGVSYRRLGVPSLEALAGMGVYYGAATSVAREMDGRDVFIVGGGNSAGQAAIHLARFARSVTIVVRRPGLAETMSAYLIKEIDTQKRITVRTGSRVVDGGGEGYLEWIDLADTDGTVERTPADGLFLLLGADPGCAWLPDEVARDERGFVLTGREIPRDRWRDGLPPAPLETTVPGIFAAGDVRAGSMKRVASASGEGAAAVAQVHAHLEPDG